LGGGQTGLLGGELGLVPLDDPPKLVADDEVIVKLVGDEGELGLQGRDPNDIRQRGPDERNRWAADNMSPN
jgi:hypothetical protein